MSAIANCETLFRQRPLYNIDKSPQGTLSLCVARSSAKLENTSLSTDGSTNALLAILSILYNYVVKIRSFAKF